ncbi:uncharacterized protein RHIMIDRAFT_301543 [Rhizopus microsporus ATCC 52813]|uniref:Uncharacterized protein n=1 Tax=Rhizopus microsporus ATCC 52813 TaxID=1340429 RepID=A0A2G4SIS6_RHIZD|nr:uncharacterized protein RHIMIDRAFT_301543 [Rhizopus microsporus ATCC 52813]PHZ08673.1 hypothetical protein RHIMIDRAFT_301543 [Rhizopus microsporus ATCC 52813]
MDGLLWNIKATIPQKRKIDTSAEEINTTRVKVGHSNEKENTFVDNGYQASMMNSEDNDIPEEHNSNLSHETDDTYNTELSNAYAEIYKVKKYVLTYHELNNETQAFNELGYDVDSDFIERLRLSSICLKYTLPGGSKIQPEDLDIEEVKNIRV